MRNRYAGKCELCEKVVPPKQGRYRLIPKITQNFTGLRCLKCSTTTKKNKAFLLEKHKETQRKLIEEHDADLLTTDNTTKV